MRILYFTDYSSVFLSQTDELLRELQRKGHKVTLFTSHHHTNDVYEVINYKKYPEYPSFYHLKVIAIRKAIKKKFIDPENTIFHVRTEILFTCVYDALKTIYPNATNNILIDIRGAVEEEIMYYSKRPLILRHLKMTYIRKVRKYTQHMKYVSVVTGTLKKYVMNKYGTDENRIFVNPCIAGSGFKHDVTNRAKIRNELGLSPIDIVVVFMSGGMSQWQNMSDIVNALQKLNIYILVLGTSKVIGKNVITMKVTYEKVPQYLSACDIGVIFRDKNIINKVALPVKYCEYIAVGLPVVTNGSIPSIDADIKKYDLGVIRSDKHISMADLSNLLSKDKSITASIAHSLYSVHHVTKAYEELYAKILVNYRSAN
jgi:hypothetical protein